MLWQYVIIRSPRTLRSNQLWITRSKATPLDIHIISSHFVTIDFHSMEAILNLIIPEASRWREIHLHLGLVQSAVHFISRIPSSLRMLQVLSVHSNEWDVDWPLSRPPPKLPFSMPSLTRLRLSGVPVDWDTFSVPNTISDLELALHPVGVRPHFSQFARILSSCRLHIRRLVLDNSGPLGVYLASGPSVPEDQRLRIVFPALTTLKLTNLLSAQLSRLIYLIDAPALQSLQLVDMIEDDFTLPLYQLGTGFSHATNIQPYTPFPSRGAYPTVSDLKLGVIELPPSPAALIAFQSLLHGMPSITRLSINFTEFKSIPAFLDVLVGIRSTSSFPPPSASQSCRPALTRGISANGFLDLSRCVS
ncbi:hypothetical protein BS47DRAFT_1175504 [Hydnum rufescens UP504]|uniref:F-box domain-containing protein n=1 Tax=Hydnum rufescens UP504 TaxID=1448309 RepID=A0A9P6DRU2_9AGAM|nr:hypothetical protein BS47DRAFT_1175504 [Hydnum rufescens UP504]